MADILSLEISLDRTKPAIWRRVLVPATVTFFDLHHILQITMGWKNSHLFEFQIDDYKIGYVKEKTEGCEDVADATEVTLDLLLLNPGMKFTYLYDFGDNWVHQVHVENVSSPEDGKSYPMCTDGMLCCPTEDSGGVDGYYFIQEILKDKKHPEHVAIKRWSGRGYDPEMFSVDKVNKELPKFKKYMTHWR